MAEKDTKKEKKQQESDKTTDLAQEAPVENAASRTAPPLPRDVHYICGTGRRKSSVARVRICPGSGKFIVNDRDMHEYFPTNACRDKSKAPLKTVHMYGSYDVFVNVYGGGVTGQADAISLGLARALARHIPEEEYNLREQGLLTRDARIKERQKPGQPGARKSFRYSKR